MEGKKFLQAILLSERLDFYEIKSLQIIIEFLYQKSKILILIYLLPLYLIQGTVFIFSIILQELKVQELHGIDTGFSKDAIMAFSPIFISLNQIVTFLMVGI